VATPALAGAQLSAPAPATPAVPVAAAQAPDSTTPAAAAAVGPVLRTSAVHVQAARPAHTRGIDGAALAATSRSQSRAMMIVGGAALITGAIIGGDPGTIVMVGGAVVGLIGLYDYLQ
jgi:hypothetical protein